MSNDDIKDYWNNQPCNIKHSPLPVGTEAYFDEVEKRKYFVEPHIIQFAGFPQWHGKKVLEIGCGIGTDAINFARFGADYTGVDISGASINLCIQRFAIYGFPGNFLCMDAAELDHFLPLHSFDLVYSFGTLHHARDPHRIAHVIRRLIKPDGRLKLMLYADNSWKSAMIIAGLDQPEAQANCPLADTYTDEEVGYLLEKYFFVQSITQTHIFPYNIEKYKNYEYEVEPWFKAMPLEMFQALEQSFGWHLLIDAVPI